MTAKELRAIRAAARNMKTYDDVFFITNKMFCCKWNGTHFEWHYPSGRLIDNLDARGVLKNIPTKPYGDKRDITEYHFEYNVSDSNIDR